MSSQLTTREGNIVKGIGSWEREQLKNDKYKELELVNMKGRNAGGRKRQNGKDNPMLYITEPSSNDRYIVSVNHIGFQNRTFLFSTCGSKSKAFEEACKYRDEIVVKRDRLKS